MTKKKLAVHPAAAAFPMMTDDELADLAADIKENGLREPIVLTPDGQLLDGRNRAAACARLNIEPEPVVYDGEPFAFVLSENVNRRHMTTGQTAMSVARLYRSVKDSTAQGVLSASVGARQQRVSEAVTVLEHAPDLADAVLLGTKALSAAVEEARARKQATDSDEAKLARLRGSAPDLADAVAEGRLTLGEAVAAAAERTKEQQRQERVNTEFLDQTVGGLARARDADGDLARQYAHTYTGPLKPDDLRFVAGFVSAIADEMEADT